MFETSHPFLFLDYFRIPYRLNAQVTTATSAATGSFLQKCAQLSVQTTLPRTQETNTTREGRASCLYWPPSDCSTWPRSWVLRSGRFLLEGASLFCRLIPDEATSGHLIAPGQGWQPTQAIHDVRGRQVASIWRDNKGNLFLPFDPSQVITNYWSERYRKIGSSVWSPARKLTLQSYYRLRPLIPRPAQIALRRVLSRVQARSAFPGWPIETSLHDLYSFLFQCLAAIARRPIPFISMWPHPYSWSLVLTHDVETDSGYHALAALREVELETGFRSAWNFVPRRYEVDDAVVEGLLAEGFEVGIHGLYHDGRDLESLATLKERLPALRYYAERWHATGFRSPATLRVWEWMPLLGFDYDSSYPDSDPFEPQPGGCCSWLPFFNEDLVELPITVPQDHTLFVILGHEDERTWIDKIERLRQAEGMALVLTHPDYLVDGRLLNAYEAVLARYSTDRSVWRALPREVSGWWRRRQGSHLRLVEGSWEVVGPASGEASVSYAQPI